MRLAGIYLSAISSEALALRSHTKLSKADPALEAEIARRKRLEQALRESEERFRDLVTGSDDLICTHDLEGCILSANPAMLRLAGYAKEELVGRRLDDFLSAETRQEFPSYLDQVAHEGQAQGFMKIVTRSGEERILEYWNRLQANALERPIVLAVAHDVQRRWAERALRLTVNRLDALLNNIPDIVWMKDDQGRFTAVNEAFARFLNRARQEIIGKTDFDFLPADLAERFQREDRTVMESGKTLQVSEQFVAPDGRTVLFETIKTPIGNGRSKPSGTVGIAREITERRRLEEQLLQSQKMEAVGRLAGGVAHDFNNLLTTILGYSDIVLGQLEQTDPICRDIEEMKKAGERAASLTHQLLAFSRKQAIEPKVLDLNAIVSEAATMLCRLIGENIDLETVLEPRLGRVRSDPGQIEQVLVNLAVNAHDAMPEGGKLVIETQNVGVYEPYPSAHMKRDSGPYVMLAVSDTGSGMDAETKSHIFEPFYTTKERGKGTGLGLATVYGIVKQSGGDIWVYSEPGRGSTFKVYLPRVEEEADRVDANLSRATPSGSETVLLVEDEEALRALARRVLEGLGYIVLAAGSAEEALRVAQGHQKKIDLLVTDVIMPGMSGPQLARCLVNDRPGMKVLFTSGYTDTAIIQQGVVDAPTAFLQKPFAPEALARKVRDILDENAK